MTREELLAALKAEQGDGDTEHQHLVADRLLVRFIDDDEIAAAYEAVDKWYA